MAEEGVGSELAPLVEAAAAAVELSELEERGRRFAHDSRASSTWRAYEADFRHFSNWCVELEPQVSALPATPATVALYLSALSETHKASTLRRRLASISFAHQVAGFETPTADAAVRAVWAGIRRTKGTAPRKVRAARTKLVEALVVPLGDGLAERRDRALILIGFASALRRSELVGLDVEDVSEDAKGFACCCSGRRPTRRPRASLEGSPMAAARRHVRFARGALGSRRQASRAAPRSARSTATAG